MVLVDGMIRNSASRGVSHKGLISIAQIPDNEDKIFDSDNSILNNTKNTSLDPVMLGL